MADLSYPTQRGYSYHANSRYASRRGVHAWITITPEENMNRNAIVHFEHHGDYSGSVDTKQVVGTQGSIEALCKKLRGASRGICRLIDACDVKPEELEKAVLECIKSLEQQTKDLKWNTENPF